MIKRLLHSRILRWVALTAAIIFISGTVNLFYNRSVHFAESKKAYEEIAEKLDTTEPGWRWGDILSARKPVPDERNCYKLQEEIVLMFRARPDRMDQNEMNRIADKYPPELERYRTL